MKIRARDVGLLAVGFIIGAVVAISLTTTQTQPAAARASRVVATGPVLAAVSLPPRVIAITNIQWEAPPIHMVPPPRLINRLESQDPLHPPVQRNVDLIDTSYQSDIKTEDLK